MDSCYFRLFILAIFVIFAHSSSAQCIKSTPCTCIHEDGMGYDLTSLKNEKYIIAKNNITFQPCKNANLTFDLSKLNESECNSTSICLLNAKNQSIDLGKFEEGVWESPNNKENAHLIFRHTTANKSITYETNINLVCCPGCVKSILNDDSIMETKYNLTFLSPKNCLIRLKSRGLSTGSVLVILLCVFSSLYFIGGAVALKVFRGAVGLELIPNYDFWSDLPALVRDGVTFTLSGCTVVSYERI